jgi:hypothetical protein
MTTSASLNNAATAMPGLGTSYAINGQTEVQANSFDSSAFTLGTFQTLVTTLTAAQVLAMYATPVQLIAAPGAGKSIQILGCLIRVTPTATQFASGGVVAPQYTNTNHGGGTLITNTLAAAVVNGASAVDTSLGLVAAGAANLTVPQNTGVFLSNATGAFTTGTGTVTVILQYAVN